MKRLLKGFTALGAISLGLGLWPTLAVAATPQPRLLTAGNFTVIANSTITNTGPTAVTGAMALSPGTSVTGFPPGLSGPIHAADAVASAAQTDLTTTVNDAAGATTTSTLTGDLGGRTLTPGVYRFASSAGLTGPLTLDGQGATNPTFIFQIGSTLTTAAASSVVLINGASGCALFWQVGTSATLGAASAFQGNLMAGMSITMTTGATIGIGGGVNGGRALAQGGAVTLDTNTLIPPPVSCAYAPAATPTPTATPTPAPSPSAIPGPTPSPGAGPGVPGSVGPTPGFPNTGAPPVAERTPASLPWPLIALGALLGASLAASGLWIRKRSA